jgi:hypothetical protein
MSFIALILSVSALHGRVNLSNVISVSNFWRVFCAGEDFLSAKRAIFYFFNFERMVLS